MLVFLIKMIIFANIKLVVIMRRKVLFAFLLVAVTMAARTTVSGTTGFLCGLC